MSVSSARISQPPVRRLLRRRSKVLIALAGLVLLAAWIDGGERALRPIAEEVEAPALQPAATSMSVPRSELGLAGEDS